MNKEGKVLNISHIQINCADLAQSVAYYNLLGFKVDRIISDDPGNPGDINDLSTVPLIKSHEGASYMVGLGLGDDPRSTTRIELAQWVDPLRKKLDVPSQDRLAIVRIALSVKGLAAILARLEAAGQPVQNVETFQITPTISSRYAHITDPDGNWLTLMEWFKSAP